MMKSDLVDVFFTKHAETEKAVLVSATGEKADAVWIPLSQIEIYPIGVNGVFEVTMPEWLALDKGLI